MTVTDRPQSAILAEECRTVGDKVRELRAIPRDKRTDEQNNELRAAAIELAAVDAEFDNARAREEYELRAAAWAHALANPPQPKARGPEAAFAETRGQRSPGDLVTESEEYRSWVGTRGGNLPETEIRTLLSSETSNPAAGIWRPVGTPFLQAPRQMRFFIRDVLNVTETGLAAVPYIRELNPATNETGATAVAEGAAKPEVTMQFEQDTAVVQKLAAWVPATMEILEDAPTLRGYINTRLAYMLQLREQAQVLTGDGSSPNLKGIFQFSGVQTITADNGDPFATIGKAIGKVENVDGTANGIVMNPTDYWTGMTLRHSSWFDGGVDGVGANGVVPFNAPPATLFDVPVIRSRTVTTLTAYVGDWAMGATLFDRMQTTIRQSDSHDTYFIYNKVAILAEERVALACHRPDFFVNATIDITP